MKKLILSLFLFIAFFSFDAFAAKNQKHVQIGIKPLGIDVNTILGLPIINLGYYFNDDWLVGVGVGVGYGSDLLVGEQEAETDEVKIKAETRYTTYGLFSRWYWSGDSGNVLFSIDKRSVEAKGTFEEKQHNIEIQRGTIEVSVITFTLGVGNEWLWDSGFYTGFDWLVKPFVMSSNVSTNLDFDNEDVLPSVEKAGKDLHNIPGVLIWSIGWAF